MLGLEAGAVDYVVKPFRLAELLARIASHLRMRGARNARAVRSGSSSTTSRSTSPPGE